MIALLVFLQFAWSAPKCEFKYDNDSSLLEWTAYKFTKRAPVKGHFKKIKVESKPAVSAAGLIKSINFEIDAFTADAGDPARNVNILEYFFKKAIVDGKIKGHVTKVNGDDKKGTVDVKFTVNGKVINQTFDYTIDEKNRFIARAESSVLSFGWKDALSSLHEACKELHKGDDGESKTWADINLYVTTVFEKDCDGSDMDI